MIHVRRQSCLVIFLLIHFFCADSLLNAQTFTNVNETCGINAIHDGPMINDGPTPDIMGFLFGSGAGWLDYNKDGNMDLYITRRSQTNLCYRNNGDQTFTEVGASLGLAEPQSDGAGIAVADFNNDGWPDIYVANGEQDKLFKNISGVSFIDISASAGLNVIDDLSRGTSASWADYDQDGYLDLYVAQHVNKEDINFPSTQDWLYHNNGDETFTDVSDVLGVDNLIGSGFIGGWTDYDRDGDPDLILVNDCPIGPTYRPTRIFRNDGGVDPLQWDFQEVSVSVGVDDCRNGMGVAIGDYNRDGWMDLAYSNIGPVVLFKNNGGTFQDVSDISQVAHQPSSTITWGCSFFDYDLDGWVDLLIATGNTKFKNHSPNFLYRNNTNGVDFTDIFYNSPSADPASTRNTISADYDNDGDLDIFNVNYGDTCRLFRNDLNNEYNFLSIELEGVISNRDGIGAYIKLSLPDGETQYFETRSGSNLGGGDTPYAHFGIANHNIILEIEIKWPSGHIQKVINVTPNQHIKIVESVDATCEEEIIIPHPTIVSRLYQSNAKITCSGIITSIGNATLQSGSSVILGEDFIAHTGCDFIAQISACEASKN